VKRPPALHEPPGATGDLCDKKTWNAPKGIQNMRNPKSRASPDSLAAVIYSTFGTFASVKKWNGVLIPVHSKFVGKYFSMDSGAFKDFDEQSAKDEKNLKQQKIDLLGDWLTSNGNIDLVTEEAKTTMYRYLYRWGKGQRGVGKTKLKNLPEETQAKISEGRTLDEALKKLDDLADSLMQGVAWLQWQNHLDFLGSGGKPELLL
jgi:cruciform cutting endonuclease 1